MGIRSHATISGSPASQLRCDVCGAQATWRQRSYSACCAYGELLCDACERRNRLRWAEKSGSFRQDASELITWVRDNWRKRMGSMRRWVRQN